MLEPPTYAALARLSAEAVLSAIASKIAPDNAASKRQALEGCYRLDRCALDDLR
jgi:hypothetical protein